ncbi:MAG: hypothetical protein ABR540_20700 [Acidimicrobiales bacterium]
MRDRVTTRNQVAGTLSRESTDEHAGGNLRQAVSRLGGQVRNAVKVTAHDLSLAEGVVVDVHHALDWRQLRCMPWRRWQLA